MEFVRYITIYIAFDPTHKGVSCDILISLCLYFSKPLLHIIPIWCILKENELNEPSNFVISHMSSEKKDSEKKELTRLPIPLSRYVLYAAVTIVGLAADLYTKWLAFSKLGMPGEYVSTAPTESKMTSVWWLMDNTVGFQTSLNEGALFGMGQGMIPLFTVMSFLAIAFLIVWLTLFRGAQSRFITVIIGLMTAGILGNLYDRMGLHHLTWNYPGELHEVGQPVYAVRDWILVMIGDWPWPNFNIADSMLVVGVSLLFIATIFFPKLVENKQSSQNAVKKDIQNTENTEK